MKILALESSAKTASVAVLDGDTLLGELCLQEARTHSETLLPAVHHVLDSLRLTLADFDKIAVAVGPGSFTGIRIAVSVAKGLSYAADKPLVGVSSLMAMAYGVKDMTEGLICPVMDARRNQVYNALFWVKENQVTRQTEDRAIALEELFAQMKEVPTLLGDGAELTATWAKQQGIVVKTLAAHRQKQRALGVGLLALETPGQSVHDVNPEYIRPSSAEEQTKRTT